MDISCQYKVFEFKIIVLLTLFAVPASTVLTSCPRLTPPDGGMVKCFHSQDVLKCEATCYRNPSFDTGQHIVERECNDHTGRWLPLSYLPRCQDKCKSRLLSQSPTYSDRRYQISASSDKKRGVPLYKRAVIGTGEFDVWRPETGDFKQFLQVEFKRPTRVNAILLKGDGSGNYVKSFRLLLSEDGQRWFPYTDGKSIDTFLVGNTNSSGIVHRKLTCPHEVKYVQLNPLSYSGHMTLAFDLIGCTPGKKTNCEPLLPPKHGAVNCEMNNNVMYCTGYCLSNKIFETGGTIVTNICDEETGTYQRTAFPRCIDSPNPRLATNDTSCVKTNCNTFPNGDYNYCDDCHHYATCVHGRLYVRLCPADLEFDSDSRRCEYISGTCPHP